LLTPTPTAAPQYNANNDRNKGPDAVIESLRCEHARNRHARYEVVAAAANPADAAAFLAVAWEYEPLSAEGGGRASGPSK